MNDNQIIIMTAILGFMLISNMFLYLIFYLEKLKIEKQVTKELKEYKNGYHWFACTQLHKNKKKSS